MEVEKKSYDVSIAGFPLKIRSGHGADTVAELVNFVDSKVTEALKLTKSGSLQTAALLASLNIAEELILLRRNALRELNVIESKTIKVLSDLEASPEKGLG